MKSLKHILLILCAGIAFTACSSDDNENSIPATEIINLASEGKSGKIHLTWNYQEGDNTNRYVEIRYYDQRKNKEVIKTVSAYTNAYTVENTFLKDGEYKFILQPFSTTFTPGKKYELSATSEKAPVTDRFEVQELLLTEANLTLFGNQLDGTPIASPVADGLGVKNLVDGNLKTRLNCNYSASVKPGAVYYIKVEFPKPQEYLKFSYNTPEAGNVPMTIECLVKANSEDEWTLIKTLTQEEDGLPVDNAGTLFVSKEIKAPFEFNYFSFRVTRIQNNKVNFSLAELRVFDVDYFYYDPEAAE